MNRMRAGGYSLSLCHYSLPLPSQLASREYRQDAVDDGTEGQLSNNNGN